MTPEMENPALAKRGVPVTDLAGASIFPEYASPLSDLQARRLTRRCAISMAMALAIAPMIHGEASNA